MRAFVQRSLACAIVGLAAGLSGRVLAQPVEEPEEIVVRGKPLSQYRLELELARNEMYSFFNEVNDGDDTDIRCRNEVPTGSRIPQRVCWSVAQDRASANGAHDFLTSLVRSAGLGKGAPAAQVNAGIAMSAAQSDTVAAGDNALIQFENEWLRVMATNQQFYEVVVKYRELEKEFDRARGVTSASAPQPRQIQLGPGGPQCETSTLTEYQQLNNVARVSGTVGISACPAGTTGSFTLVAQVRGEAGAITPIEFSETWHRADAQDHTFNSDYPIGDNVELVNVRVRNLTCTCEGPTQ